MIPLYSLILIYKTLHQFLRKGSLLPVEGFKHHTEAATGDGVGDRDGGREIM
jgi:hypothetical protein